MSIVLILILVLPLLIWPGVQNAFNLPKYVVLLAGAGILAIITRKRINSTAEKLIFLIICLNIASLFYTLNPYYSRHAVGLNLACLVVLYYIGAHSNQGWNEILMKAIVISGVAVSIIAILQAYGVWLFLKLPTPKIVSTIGNPNFLGAYLIVPFFVSLKLAFKEE